MSFEPPEHFHSTFAVLLVGLQTFMPVHRGGFWGEYAAFSRHRDDIVHIQISAKVQSECPPHDLVTPEGHIPDGAIGPVNIKIYRLFVGCRVHGNPAPPIEHIDRLGPLMLRQMGDHLFSIAKAVNKELQWGRKINPI